MIRLYHCAEARSTRSLWLLNELELEVDLIEMPFDTRHLRGPDYLSIHPLGRVPCLVDGEMVLFESGAICQYLCETYDDGRLGRAPGHPERSAWLQWLHYAETVAVHGANLVQQNWIIAEPDRSPVVLKLESRRLEKALGVLDDQLAHQPYLLASGFSAVDTAVGYSVYLARMFLSLDPFPNVSAYLTRLLKRPAFQDALPKGK